MNPKVNETLTPRPRWWPALVVVLLALVACVYVWIFGDATGRQERVMKTGAVVILAGFLLGLWFVFFSRLRWRLRLAGLAAGILLVVVFGALFRIQGVTGDLIPILEWRWGARSASLEASADGTARLSGRPAFPQFLGATRNGVISGVALEPDWSSHPPEELWRREIGEGFSSFAVVGDLAITQEQRGDEELVVAYERDTGEVQWVSSAAARYSTAIAGTGPRATPTVDGDQVFTMGATGWLRAHDLATGETLWAHDILAEHGGQLPEWGVAGSPLVVVRQVADSPAEVDSLEGEDAAVSTAELEPAPMPLSPREERLVVISAGGPSGASLVAYDATSGELVWAGGDDGMSYSAPAVLELAGVSQIVQFNLASITGHRIEDGAVLWSHPWSREQPNVAQPLLLPGSRLLISSGYGIGAEVIRIEQDVSGFQVISEWSSPRLKAKFSNPVFHRGSVYGLDDGVLVCLDPESGERRWKRGRYGHGQLLLVGEHLLIQAEDGRVVVVDANPEEPIERASFGPLEHRTWNTLALAGDQLFLRNDREAVVYRIALAEGAEQ